VLILCRIFRKYPKYWDIKTNKWKKKWFKYEESDGEVCSDLQCVYDAADGMARDNDSDSQF